MHPSETTNFFCPICGHTLIFQLSIEATLKSLEDMNWKNRVKKAMDSIREGSFSGRNWKAILNKQLELEAETK